MSTCIGQDMDYDIGGGQDCDISHNIYYGCFRTCDLWETYSILWHGPRSSHVSSFGGTNKSTTGGVLVFVEDLDSAV